MQKLMRPLAFVLSMTMIYFLFTGCNSTVSNTDTPTSNLPADDAGVTESEEAVEAPDYFPLAETETISYWYTFPPFFAAFISGPSEGDYFQELERRTNVVVEFEVISIETSNDSFNIMAASGSYPDVIQGGEGLFTGGGDAAVEQEAFVPLNDYIQQYAPDYVARLDEFDAWKDVTTDGGNTVSFFSLKLGKEGPDKGLAIRQDWLDELNMEMPNTYTALYDVLKAFQSELGIANPMPMHYQGTFDTNSLVMGYETLGATFPTQNNYPFYQIDGNVQYGPITDGFKEYLTMLNQWYSEGLISADFITKTERADTSTDLIYNEEVGIMHMQDTNMNTTASSSGVEGMKLSALPQIVKEEGQQLHLYVAPKISSAVTISKNAEDAGKMELICRWLNYNYTEEGMILFNYGIEGRGLAYDDNGKPMLSELVTNNPDDIPMNIALAIYAQQSGPALTDSTKTYANAAENEVEAQYLWKGNSDGAWVYPAFATMNSEESSEFSQIFSDINTFVGENVVRFINGDRSLDQWDDYVANIEQMNIARVIELKQAAYERYMAR